MVILKNVPYDILYAYAWNLLKVQNQKKLWDNEQSPNQCWNNC